MQLNLSPSYYTNNNQRADTKELKKLTEKVNKMKNGQFWYDGSEKQKEKERKRRQCQE